MDCSTPGVQVHHQLTELTQINVRQVSDAIHPSHPLSPLSPLVLNLSQHQGPSIISVGNLVGKNTDPER